VGGEVVGRSGRFTLRRDIGRWPDGLEGPYSYLEAPSAAVIVPLLEDGSTVLVRQWRHPWNAPSWEVPAGTLEEGEDPLVGARRELSEEAGLEAAGWTPLGTTRGSAASTMRFHLYLAQGLTRVERAPESYEQDMVVSELPFGEALAQAFEGGIEHAASIVALVRAARHLGLL
jgi:8-oxo-dGTP pyrophosphatase MutT (NUDIX family)